MKIYVGSIFLNKFNDDKLDKKETINNYIYSNNGVYTVNNNSILKLISNDIPIEKYSFKNYNFIIDKSKYIFRKNVYNIDYLHYIKKVKKIEYTFNNKSRVTMVIEECNNKRIDLYFETQEDELYIELKEDIIKYLELFQETKNK